MEELYKPTRIRIWEDQPKHALKFKTFFKEKLSHLEWELIEVESAETFLPRQLELELVTKLKENSKNNTEWKEVILYTGVILGNQSVELLKKEFPPIPGWKPFYHHMTICLGSLKNQSLNSGLPLVSEIGKTIQLEVVGVGKNEIAYAAEVTGYISTNKRPHITMCIAPGFAPAESNNINTWTSISKIEKIIISGEIQENKIFTIKSNRRKNNNADRATNKKINLGKLVIENTTKKGKEVSEAIKKNNGMDGPTTY